MSPRNSFRLHEAFIPVSRTSLRKSPRFSFFLSLFFFTGVLGGWFYFTDEKAINVEELILSSQVTQY